jgi:hypothetical protein
MAEKTFVEYFMNGRPVVHAALGESLHLGTFGRLERVHTSKDAIPIGKNP